MAAVLAEGETIVGHAACEPHIQDLCRFLVSLGARDRGHRLERAAHRGRRSPRRRRLPHRPRARRGRELRGAGRRDGRRPHGRGRPARRPDLDRACLPEARDRVRGGGDHPACPCRAGDARRRRPRRTDSEDRERHLAGVPRRPHVDRGRRGNAGSRHSAGVREDVREPAVLRRQARLDGRAHHPLRPAPRGRDRPCQALRAAARKPRHPRRHGDGDRGPVRRGRVDASATSGRSTAATSASTSGSARSAPISSASSCERRPAHRRDAGQRTSRRACRCSTTCSPSSRAPAASTSRWRSSPTSLWPRSMPPGQRSDVRLPRCSARRRARRRARCLPAEALAMVVVEASGRPLVASNADLTGAGGLGTDLAGTLPRRPRGRGRR